VAVVGVPRHLLVARPWRSRTGRLLHRALDAAAWAALDRDRDPGRRPTAAKLEGLAVSYDQKPRIVLAELWERQSSKGNAYFSGFMGHVSVALLRDGERPHPTRPGETVTVWKLVAQERERPPKPRQSPPGRDPGPGRGNEPRAAGVPPDGPGRPYRRESETARRERVASEIAREHGLERDPDDALPF
jgi:hypothetical protein